MFFMFKKKSPAVMLKTELSEIEIMETDVTLYAKHREIGLA